MKNYGSVFQCMDFWTVTLTLWTKDSTLEASPQTSNLTVTSLYEHMIGCESSCSVKEETKKKLLKWILSTIDFNFYIWPGLLWVKLYANEESITINKFAFGLNGLHVKPWWPDCPIQAHLFQDWLLKKQGFKIKNWPNDQGCD